MAGKPKKMSQAKQILQMHKQDYGNKTIARNLGISKNTVKSYLDKYRSSKLSLETLLKMEDHDLEKVFHPGNPAYKDTGLHPYKSDFLIDC
jgi:response regulator of citrate/malate metabolism